MANSGYKEYNGPSSTEKKLISTLRITEWLNYQTTPPTYL